MIVEDPVKSMPCSGVVRTRSTTSTTEAFDWLLHGYRVHQRVQVLSDPHGTSKFDIKIVGMPLPLWYNVDRLVLWTVWVLGFGALFWVSHTQIASIARARK